MTEEDEAFNEIERKAKQRIEAVRATTQAWRESASDYERGFIDGMQKQMQSSVDKAVNAMSQRTWVDLTEVQIQNVYFEVLKEHRGAPMPWGQVQFGKAVLEKFKEKNT